MNAFNKTPIAAVAILLLSAVGATIWWYFSPARIEEMNQLLYCACGYSRVEFANGNITMIKPFHDSVKSGEPIGKYSMKGEKVEIELYFNGKTNIAAYQLDHVGLRTSDPLFRKLEHQAVDGGSLKLSIRKLFRNN